MGLDLRIRRRQRDDSGGAGGAGIVTGQIWRNNAYRNEGIARGLSRVSRL